MPNNGRSTALFLVAVASWAHLHCELVSAEHEPCADSRRTPTDKSVIRHPLLSIQLHHGRMLDEELACNHAHMHQAWPSVWTHARVPPEVLMVLNPAQRPFVRGHLDFIALSAHTGSGTG